MPSIKHIYEIDQILRSHRYPVSLDTLIDRLGCSRATVNRALRDMRDWLNAPIDNSRGEGYQYAKDNNFELPGIWLNANELESLLVVDSLLENLQPGLLKPRIHHLRSKMWQMLDKSAPSVKDGFPRERFRVLASHVREIPAGIFQATAQALIERRRLAFTYTGRADNHTSERETSPQRLVYYKDHWYLDAWDEQKEALRTFALDRMRTPRIAKAAARNMDVDELDASLTVGYGLFAGPVEDLARLVFEQPLGEWVSKEIWHPDQQGRLREDGRYELTLPYSDGRELLGEILRHGGQVRVEAPESLVALVRDSLRATLSLYAD